MIYECRESDCPEWEESEAGNAVDAAEDFVQLQDEMDPYETSSVKVEVREKGKEGSTIFRVDIEITKDYEAYEELSDEKEDGA